MDTVGNDRSRMRTTSLLVLTQLIAGIALAALLPGHRAEYDDTLAAWILVDAHGHYYTIEDAQRITSRMIAQKERA